MRKKNRDKMKSFEDSDTVFLCFDLQQCLPTPLLRSGLSFYKRSLWTYNLTVFSVVNCKKRAQCFMWDETTGQRGGQEIASCLLKFFKTLPINVREINMYSDCCSGQTRNIYFTVMALLYMEKISRQNGSLQILNHKYLIPGHTHMEADSIHATIEKAKNTHTCVKIEVPSDWMNLIRMIHCRTPIHVEEMMAADFLNFSSVLTKNFIHRKINTDGEPVNWLGIRCIQYRRNSGTVMHYKKSLDEPFLSLDLRRKRGQQQFQRLDELGSLYDKQIPLPSKKLDDIKSILSYIHPSSRSFYRHLNQNDNVKDTGPYESSSDEEMA